MKSAHHRLVYLFLLMICFICAASQVRRLNSKTSATTLKTAGAATQAKLSETYGRLPLNFEVNRGQADPSIKFLARGGNYSFSLAPTEATLHLRDVSADRPATMRMKLINANPSPKIEGMDQLPGRSNYLIGANPKQWRTDIPNYAGVRYDDVWPGVDAIFFGNQRRLEYDFMVAPGANPRAIKLSFEGAKKISVDANGDLILRLEAGELRQLKPVVYQEVNGEKHRVSGRYVVKGDQVGFEIGRYDRTRELVIDPTLAYSTAGIGGVSIAVDAMGNAYVTGTTISLDFPKVNPFQSSLAGGEDAFVAKLNSAGTALVYSTYLGGNSLDQGRSIAVDAAGNAYIAGFSQSNDFPGATGSKVGRVLYKSVNSGGDWTASDAGLPTSTIDHLLIDPKTPDTIFAGVSGLAQAGIRARVYKTTDGGKNWVAADSGLSIIRKITALVMNPVNTGELYALDSSGKLSKTVNGGVSWEAAPTAPTFTVASAIALDPSNPMTIYATNSLNRIYKSADGGNSWGVINTNLGSGVFGIVILVVDPANPNTLYAASDSGGGVFKSLDGGANWMEINTGLSAPSGRNIKSLTIDPKNNSTIYVLAGIRKGIFKSVDGGALWTPINSGLPLQGSSVAFDSGRIVVDPSNSSSLYAAIGETFVGGGVYKSVDGGASWNRSGESAISGPVTSVAVDPINPATIYAGLSQPPPDAYVVKLNAAGSALLYSTFISGSGTDYATDVAVDSAGNAFVVGVTQSNDFSPLPGAFQRALNGDGSLDVTDAFLARLNSSGTVTYSTYLGGADAEGSAFNLSDTAPRVAVDRFGKVYVAGSTASQDFPLKNAFQSTVAEGFVAKIDPDQSGDGSLLYSTYLGIIRFPSPSAPNGDVKDIAVDNEGAIYVLGRGEIAATPGAFQNGNGSSYLLKLNPEGTALVYATRLGEVLLSGGVGDPSVVDLFNSVAVDTNGNAYLTGATDRRIPITPNAIQPDIAGGSPGKCFDNRFFPIRCADAFVMKINASGSTLLYSSYLGGDLTDGADSIAIDAAGNAYVTGRTGSSNFPTTTGAFESPFREKFVSKIATNPGDIVGTLSTHVSAASFLYPSPLAPESIISAFGSNLATTTASASSLPLPETLGGTTVTVDGRAAQLFFVSPTQINYLIPPETRVGIPAPIMIVSGDGSFSASMIETSRVSPGIFSANADGQGPAAAIAIRFKAGGSEVSEPAVRFDSTVNKFVTVPIDLGPEDDQVFLSIFGTGLRFRTSESAVKVTIDGVEVPVSYAGLQPTFIGLDQINALLLRTLAGKGEVDLKVTVDGKVTNTTRVNIK